MSPFWLGLWACTLALGWLLPNHYYPWLSFHVDAWVASVLSIATAAVIIRTRGPIIWHRMTLLVALLLCIPGLQYFFGLLPLAGTAWISSIYLLGLLLALLTGARWEAANPGQLADVLFLAIGAAAIFSVGLQLQRWLGLDGLELWTLGGGPDRPSANFGQPNQLATFLLWGLLATAWGLIRQRIGVGGAILMAFYLLFGLALTGSRTAWIAVALLVTATWLWRRLWTGAHLPWVATGLGLYFVLCVVSVGRLQTAWQGKLLPDSLQSALGDITRMSGEARPLAWAVFVDAAWQRPWLGYGWNQGVLAQVSVAQEHPQLFGVFRYAHNLFLDLVLWCGLPIGLLVSASLLYWFWKRLRAVQNAENAVLILFLLVIGNHAMLELPLYFGYFLLPVGMIMGTLNLRLGASPVIFTRRWVAVVLWLAATTLLALTIRDYARTEPHYRLLRMEWDGFTITSPKEAPDVLLLTQWRDYIRYARFEPKAGLTSDELNWMRHITGLFPSAIFIHKLATGLALNQQPEEARLWLKRMCKIFPEGPCLTTKRVWARQALQHPEIAAIPWPN